MAGEQTRRAVILAVGSELTTGETRDTNGGELAHELTALGVEVARVASLPDDLELVTGAFREALADADVVVSTGGLGPTPDDLTREAIAGALGVEPAVDPELEAWLRDLFDRRGIRMPDANRKQAWLIPGASAIPNRNGTAPGWWVEWDGRFVVALPGPPRELRPMWAEEVVPRLRARGIGADIAVRTLRLTGIGESHVAEALGEAMLRAANPQVATYAKPDAVDVRIVARPIAGGDGVSGRSARDVLAETERAVEERLGRHVFAHDGETWVDALATRLAGRTVAAWERGTGGALAGVLGFAPWLVLDEIVGGEAGSGAETGPVTGPAEETDAAAEDDGESASAAERRASAGDEGDGDDGRRPAAPPPLDAIARHVRMRAGTDIGLAVDARPDGADTRVHVVVDGAGLTRSRAGTAFLGGEQGRRRAATTACTLLWEALGEPVKA